jgi:hypothetical protein
MLLNTLFSISRLPFASSIGKLKVSLEKKKELENCLEKNVQKNKK